jgi:son of sevenless-like protein
MMHRVSFLSIGVPCILSDHTPTDTKYNKTFLMTYKSFTTTNELFDLLVARFWIKPPENIAPAELEEWKRLKQHVVRARLVLLWSPPLIAAQYQHKSSEYFQVDDRRQ